jgi:uncharacterized OB-fold protein
LPILPAVTPLTQPYWDAARQRRLVFQQCRACGTNWHPPMPRCPHCHAADIDWRASVGTGTIFTYTIVHHPTHPAFADKIPYVVAVVELDEGPRIVTNIKRCEAGDVRCGMRVSIFFEDVSLDVTLPMAEPV